LLIRARDASFVRVEYCTLSVYAISDHSYLVYLGIVTGNPRVSQPVPVPVPVETRTRHHGYGYGYGIPAGFSLKSNKQL